MFLRWFEENRAAPFITFYGYGRDLEDEFAELSEIIRYQGTETSKHEFGATTLERIRRRKSRRLSKDIPVAIKRCLRRWY